MERLTTLTEEICHPQIPTLGKPRKLCLGQTSLYSVEVSYFLSGLL